MHHNESAFHEKLNSIGGPAPYILRNHFSSHVGESLGRHRYTRRRSSQGCPEIRFHQCSLNPLSFGYSLLTRDDDLAKTEFSLLAVKFRAHLGRDRMAVEAKSCLKLLVIKLRHLLAAKLWQPEFISQNPHGGRRALIPLSSSDLYMHMWYA